MSDKSFTDEMDPGEGEDWHRTRLATNHESDQSSLLVWGDSHAMAALPAIDLYLNEMGLHGEAATHYNTAPVLGWYKSLPYGMNEESLNYSLAVLQRIEKDKIKNVLLVAFWQGYVDDHELGETDEFKKALLSTVAKLSSIGSRVWIMREVPIHTYNVPRALSLPIYPAAFTEELRKKDSHQINIFDEDYAKNITNEGGTFLDPKTAFIDDEGHYLVELNGEGLYRDTNHLTATGSRLVLLPFFRKNLLLTEHADAQ